MSFLVAGTDTEAGKTTFSLLWLAAYEDYLYWKPLETGEPDSELIGRLIGRDRVLDAVAQYAEPVAPELAAEREGRQVPDAAELLRACPLLPDGKHMLVETFGSPFSPLTGKQLQLEFLRQLRLPTVVVTPSRVGAIGRTLQCMRALVGTGVQPGVVTSAPPEPENCELQRKVWPGTEVATEVTMNEPMGSNAML